MPKQPRPTAGEKSPAVVFVDSSAWLALFNERDARHADAERLFPCAIERGARLLTTNLVIAETHRLTLFHFGIRAAKHVVDHLSHLPEVVIHFADRANHDAALQWLRKLGDQRLTYADAVSFAVMNAARCTTAFTFDEDFSIAGFTLWQHVA